MVESNELLALRIDDIAKLIRNRELSPVELAKKTLDRIENIEPYINAFITVNKTEILKSAKRAEEEIMAGNYKGPLHGIPIGIKDMIFTKNIRTTMGSEIYKDFVPVEDAYIIKKLKKAGAIIFGKHNTHEFAYGPTGDRSYFGPVHNPYDTRKMTGGSSSGSAAAVATGMNFGAIGTDTGGSVRIPASFCGIVGMKPTYGRISKRGVHPLSWHLDHIGPMTRTVKDNALLLNAIQGYDEMDDVARFTVEEDFTTKIGTDITNLRIGVPKAFFYHHLNAEVKEKTEEQIRHLETLGATVKEVTIDNIEDFYDAQRAILASDAFALHKEHLEKYPDMWDDEVKERLYTALDVIGYEYAQAITVKREIKKSFERTLKEVDCLITPTVPILPIDIDARHVDIDKYNEEHIRWSILKLTSPTNLIGLPSLSVPVGFSNDGLPIGVQFIANDFQETTLYQVGYALEQYIKIPTYKGDINITHLEK